MLLNKIRGIYSLIIYTISFAITHSFVNIRMRKATLQNTESVIAKESAKPRRNREYTDEQIQEREERKASKKAEEDAIKEQQAANKESRSQQAEARLKFLLSQSDIFSHFGSVKDGICSST